MASNALLTTAEVADLLGVSTGFVRGEVKSGRLRAAVAIERESQRTLYRFDAGDLRAYCQRYSPNTLPRLPQAS